MKVNHRGAYAAMAQQPLYREQVGAHAKQMRRETMPQAMQVDILCNTARATAWPMIHRVEFSLSGVPLSLPLKR